MNILYRSQVYIDNAYSSSTDFMRERERGGEFRLLARVNGGVWQLTDATFSPLKIKYVHSQMRTINIKMLYY